MREDRPYIAKSMVFVEPLEEASALIIPPYIILLGDDKWEAERTDEGPKIASLDVIEETSEIPLQIRIIPLEEVKVNIERWRASIEIEYESLVSKTEAAEPLSEEAFQEPCKTSIELI